MTKKWVIYLVVGLLVLVIGGILGFIICSKTTKKCEDTTALREELYRLKDSINDIRYIINLNKVYYNDQIDSLEKINKVQYDKYKKLLKDFTDVDIISDDSITMYISNYLHNRR